ncbi:aspartic proteinase CDR1-like [Lotus japonicus]|uniref:aspartic proteinase CDR1-like n=1 Tax=Lotus japonicus TaxID=34305 RepID=UPI002587AAEB|nr:aspartic proteinase CDR1-like [Lotus japonicus]
MAFEYELMHILLLLAFSTCCFSSIHTSTTTASLGTSKSKPHRLVSKLIHHRSVLHPHYNPKETAKDRMKLDIQHSVARLAYLRARIDNGSLISNDYRASLSPSLTSRTILANLSIGQPPTPQLVIMDTGSARFWVMCTPCLNCVHHSLPIFDPSKSSTYFAPCRTPCGFSGCKCDLSDRFTFNVNYADGSSSSGTLGRDMLVFETADEGTVLVPYIEFGCGHQIRYNKDPGYNGILGLNSGPVSLVSQIGRRFSYCIGSLTDKNYNYNQLILGEGADLEGYSTPLQEHRGFYYITMEGISVGEKRLDLAPTTFEMKEDGTGGVIIDTGTTMTYLVDDAYKLLYREVRNILRQSLKETTFENIPWQICYLGDVSRDLVRFPVVTFHFDEGADLALDPGSLFEQVTDNAFCMVVGPISEFGLGSIPSIIGLSAQQSYNVGYDLENGFLYFQRIDCELLSG